MALYVRIRLRNFFSECLNAVHLTFDVYLSCASIFRMAEWEPRNENERIGKIIRPAMAIPQNTFLCKISDPQIR